MFDLPSGQSDTAETCLWPGCGSGRDLAHERDPGFASAFVPLWRVRLDVDAAPPGLRVVHSPDLRPEALLGSLHEPRNKSLETPAVRFPGGGPPPLGDLAPWLLGREVVAVGKLDPTSYEQLLRVDLKKAEASFPELFAPDTPPDFGWDDDDFDDEDDA